MICNLQVIATEIKEERNYVSMVFTTRTRLGQRKGNLGSILLYPCANKCTRFVSPLIHPYPQQDHSSPCEDSSHTAPKKPCYDAKPAVRAGISHVLGQPLLPQPRSISDELKYFRGFLLPVMPCSSSCSHQTQGNPPALLSDKPPFTNTC